MVPIQYLLRFIEEDSPFGDITSDTVIPDKTCNAVIRAEQEGSYRRYRGGFSPLYAFRDPGQTGKTGW